MKRRHFIGAALAATASPALGFQAQITEMPDVDPIREWLDQWREVKDEWGILPDGSSDAESLFSRATTLEEMICRAKPSTPDGAVAQLDLVLDNRSFVGSSIEDMEDRILFSNLRDAIIKFAR